LVITSRNSVALKGKQQILMAAVSTFTGKTVVRVAVLFYAKNIIFPFWAKGRGN
jgi:hypothetical protein